MTKGDLINSAAKAALFFLNSLTRFPSSSFLSIYPVGMPGTAE